jgi:catechol 2,3-dioxygenase-like lactoylglutathione lyase family enzyme
MEILHVGLVASSEENADRFFKDVLGLEKSEPKILDEKLTRAIFGFNQELLMIRYQTESGFYEIFVQPGYQAPQNQVAHSCLKVDNLTGFVEKCRHAGVKVNEVPKGSSVVTFISDFDGNLFEMKE